MIDRAFIFRHFREIRMKEKLRKLLLDDFKEVESLLMAIQWGSVFYVLGQISEFFIVKIKYQRVLTVIKYLKNNEQEIFEK